MDGGDGSTSLVIDNGSFMCKAGFFTGDDTTRAFFPSIIGHPLTEESTDSNSYIGCDVYSKMDLLKLTFPVQRGIVTNWDDMEKIWHYLFYEKLHVAPEEHSVMLTEASLNPRSNREKMAQTMFETFNVPAMFVLNSAVVALYESDITTGIVLDSGHGVTHVVPVYQGYALPNAVLRVNFGGHDLTEYMKRLLTERGHHYKTFLDLEGVRQLKDLSGYVALDFDEEITKDASEVEKAFIQPSGRVTVGHERFRCAEALFQPALVGIDKEGIPEMIVKSIRMCDKSIHKYLYGNIVLSGGGTMFPGFVQRLEKDISNLAPSGMKIKVIAPEGRKYSAWAGGMMLGSLFSFQHKWVTKQEYDESGASIVHRKCF